MSEIEVRDVSKEYRVRDRRPVLALELLRSLALGGGRVRHVQALRGVSFDVERGEAFGIVGANGSGKSTLLRILSGVTEPTAGSVRVRGRVSALLELGAGFHQDLTGRENVWLGAAMMGLSRAQIRSRLDEIVAFAELESSIDQPVFTYSSGMLVRLGFSVSMALDPDVLILDEVLAVGDHSFRAKSHKAILDFRRRGKTIVLVSHDLHEVVGFCGRALLLADGAPVLLDAAAKVVPFYIQTAGAREGQCFASLGRLAMAFTNGRLHLFWDGVPVTQYLGFYSSFLVARNWFDSGQASWRIDSATSSRFQSSGELMTLPITLSVSAEIRNEHEVDVEVRAWVRQETTIEQFHASLLLQAGYRSWSCPPDGGDFPRIDVASHEWVHVNPVPLTGDRISAEGGGALPDVTLITREMGSCPTVLNTDHSSNSRVLQFLRTEGVRWEEGEHLVFAGRIELGP